MVNWPDFTLPPINLWNVPWQAPPKTVPVLAPPRAQGTAQQINRLNTLRVLLSRR